MVEPPAVRIEVSEAEVELGGSAAAEAEGSAAVEGEADSGAVVGATAD